MNKVDICGVSFDNVTIDEALAILKDFLSSPTPKIVVTPNSEIVQACIEDSKIKTVISQADLTVPDGIGVIYASRILGRPIKEKVAGFELAYRFLPVMADMGKKLFILGGKPGVAETAQKNLKAEFPNLEICGVHDGYFSDGSQIASLINTSGADVVFVCLGAPKQEMWMVAHKNELKSSIMLGLGGSVDVYAGNVKRSPKLFVSLGLEWFYRLLKEPWRIKRMMKLPKFLISVIWNRANKPNY